MGLIESELAAGTATQSPASADQMREAQAAVQRGGCARRPWAQLAAFPQPCFQRATAKEQNYNSSFRSDPKW